MKADVILIERVLANDPSLVEIVVDERRYFMDELKELLQALKVNNTVKILTLKGCGLSDKECDFGKHINKSDIVVLAELILANKTIQKLDLEDNLIHTKGVKILANALEKNSSIYSLNLNCNPIGDEGGVVLANMLRNHREIYELKISPETGMLYESDGMGEWEDKCITDLTKAQVDRRGDYIENPYHSVEPCFRSGTILKIHPFVIEKIQELLKQNKLFLTHSTKDSLELKKVPFELSAAMPKKDISSLFRSFASIKAKKKAVPGSLEDQFQMQRLCNPANHGKTSLTTEQRPLEVVAKVERRVTLLQKT